MSNGNNQRYRYRSLPALVGGAVVILFGVLLLGDSVIRGSGRSAWLSAFGLLAGIGMVYLVSVRPAVIAKDDVLLIRNPLQDIEIPWGSIDELRIRYQLDIEADGQVAHAWAVPGSRGSRQRDLRRQLRVYDADLKMGLSTKEDPLPRRGSGYAERVLEELTLIAGERNKVTPAEGQPVVTTRWAWPVIVPIAACALAFLLILLLG